MIEYLCQRDVSVVLRRSHDDAATTILGISCALVASRGWALFLPSVYNNVVVSLFQELFYRMHPTGGWGKKRKQIQCANQLA